MDRDEEERLQQPDLTAFSDEDGDSGDESEHEIPEQTDRQDQRQQQRQPAGRKFPHFKVLVLNSYSIYSNYI